MSDIKESGKAWIPFADWREHFKGNDVCFAAKEDVCGNRWMELIVINHHARGYQVKYLKLATVEWPQWPYEAEDIGKEES